MIVMKNISQPYGPTYSGLRGMVIKNPMAMNGVVVKRPFGYGGYGGVIVDQPRRLPWRGYNDLDLNQLLNTGIASTGSLITGVTGIINTVTGANKTGTVTIPGVSQSIPGNTGYAPPSTYAMPSMMSSIPTYVWIAGGVLLLGGAAVLLMK